MAQLICGLCSGVSSGEMKGLINVLWCEGAETERQRERLVGGEGEGGRRREPLGGRLGK